MRGTKAKQLRKFAKQIAVEEQLPVVSYGVKNEQTRFNPYTDSNYKTVTIVLQDSVRKVYKKLKKNSKLK